MTMTGKGTTNFCYLAANSHHILRYVYPGSKNIKICYEFRFGRFYMVNEDDSRASILMLGSFTVRSKLVQEWLFLLPIAYSYFIIIHYYTNLCIKHTRWKLQS